MLLVLRGEDVAAEGIVLVDPPEAVHCVGRETLLRRAVHVAGGRGGDHEVGGIDWTQLYLSTPANSECVNLQHCFDLFHLQADCAAWKWKAV